MNTPMSVFLFAVICLISSANAANILCLMGAASETAQVRSHELFKYVSERGHKLTILGEAGYIKKVLGRAKEKNITDNISYIDITIKAPKMAKNYDIKRNLLFTAYQNMMMWYNRLLPICKDLLRSEGFKTVLNMGIKKREQSPFDLIIYDVINAPPCMLSLAQAFVHHNSATKDVPLIGLNLNALILPEVFEQARGGMINPASVPHFMSDFDEEMYFFERCHNLVLYMLSYIVRHWILSSKMSELTNKYLVYRNASFYLDYESIMQRVKLIIVNTHPVFNYAQPLPSNVIEISGWHITDNKPLLSGTLEFINRNSSRGIIFISLGYHYRIEDPTEQKRTQDILAVIKRMPEFVFLWKVKNGKSVRKRPKNLYMSDYLSENDVLALSRTRIYLTDADTLKLQEAMYHGVPVVAVALLIDQITNAKRVYDRHLGVRIPFDNWIEGNLHSAFTHILKKYNSFNHNAQITKVSFRNRAFPPLQIVTWWIEQIIKTPEIYNNLVSSTGGKLNYFVLQSWDVLALMTVLFGVWSWIFYIASYSTQIYLVHGGGRYYMIRLIRLFWRNFAQEEVQQQIIEEIQEQNVQREQARQQVREKEREDRARARGRGRGRGNRKRR